MAQFRISSRTDSRKLATIEVHARDAHSASEAAWARGVGYIVSVKQRCEARTTTGAQCKHYYEHDGGHGCPIHDQRDVRGW